MRLKHQGREGRKEGRRDGSLELNKNISRFPLRPSVRPSRCLIANWRQHETRYTISQIVITTYANQTGVNNAVNIEVNNGVNGSINDGVIGERVDPTVGLWCEAVTAWRRLPDDEGNPIGDERYDEDPAEDGGKTCAERIVVVAREGDDAIGNLQQDGRGHEPAEAMDRERRLPIAVGQMHETSRQTAAGTVDVKDAARQATLRHWIAWQPAKLDPLVGAYLKDERQDDNRTPHRQHGPMPTQHEGVISRRVAHRPVEISGMSRIV